MIRVQPTGKQFAAVFVGCVLGFLFMWGFLLGCLDGSQIFEKEKI